MLAELGWNGSIFTMGHNVGIQLSMLTKRFLERPSQWPGWGEFFWTKLEPFTARSLGFGLEKLMIPGVDELLTFLTKVKVSGMLLTTIRTCKLFFWKLNGLILTVCR